MRTHARIASSRVLGIIGLCVLTVVTVAMSGFAVRAAHTAPRETTKWPAVQALNDQPVAVFLGGSEAASASGKTAWPALVSNARGWQEVNLSSSGTGYLATGKCGSVQCPNYLESVPEVVALAPSIVVVSGGASETASDTDMSVQIAATFQNLRQGLPNATIVAVGPAVADVQPSSSVTNIDKAVKTAAQSFGLRYVDLLNPTLLNASMVSNGSLTDTGQAAIAARVVAALK